MTDILTSDFLKSFIDLTCEGVSYGWHERNGGNLSYRIPKKELEPFLDTLNFDSEAISIGTDVPTLAGEYFLVTGSGKFLKNIVFDPEDTLALVQIDNSGKNYKILWGMKNGGKPTSEFPTHLECHAIKKAQDEAYCVIYHAHPVHTIALSSVLPSDDDIVTKATWGTMTECPVIYPKGLGVVSWMVPGGKEIAQATSEKMKEFGYDAVIWALHGIFCAGKSFDDAISLMHVIEKSAHIFNVQTSMGVIPANFITEEGYRQLAQEFNITLKESSLKAKVVLKKAL